MGLFDKLTTSDDIQDQKDSVGSGGITDTGLYDFTIEYAYVDFSKSEAMNINLKVVNENGKSLRLNEYVTSGAAKGKLNYYTTAKGEKRYLPGFEKINHICLLAIGKELSDIEPEEKVLNLYNPELQKEAATKKQVLTDLTGAEITLGLVKIMEDQYSDPTKSRSKLEINKVFRSNDGFTVQEIKDEEEEASFINTWRNKYTSDFVIDKREQSKEGGSQPAADKPKKSAMFAKK